MMLNKVLFFSLCFGYLAGAGQVFAEGAPVSKASQEEAPGEKASQEESSAQTSVEQDSTRPQERNRRPSKRLSREGKGVLIAGSSLVMSGVGLALGANYAGTCEDDGAFMGCFFHGFQERFIGIGGGAAIGVLLGIAMTDFTSRTHALWIGTLSGTSLGMTSIIIGEVQDSPGWGIVGGVSAVVLGVVLGYALSDPEPSTSHRAAWLPTLALDGEGGGQVGLLTRW